MVYISFFDSSLEIIQTKRTFFGEKIIASVHQTVPDGVIVKGKIVDVAALAQFIQGLLPQAYPQPIDDGQLSVALPDFSLLFERFAIPKDRDIRDEMQRVLATATSKAAHNPQDYENYYKVLAQTDDSTLVFYTAIEKEILASYTQLAQQLGMELSFTSSRSFAAYEVIRDLIQETQTVVCVVLHAHAVEYIMLDAYGPVAYALHRKSVAEKAAGAVQSAIAALRGNTSLTLGGVLLAGEGAVEESVAAYVADLQVPVQKLEDVMGRILRTAGIRFDTGGIPAMLFAFPLGVYLGKKRADAPNFTLDAAYTQPQAPAPAAQQPSTPPQEVFPMVEHRSSGRLPWVILLLCIALGLAVGAWVVWKGVPIQLSFNGFSAGSTPTPTAAPTAVPTVPVTPTIDPSLKRSDLKLSVQNGSGKSGYAKEIADMLEKKGYRSIAKGNADRQDYTQTIVRIKAAKKTYQPLLLADLKDQFPSAQTEELDAKDSHDVVIILGK